MEQNVLSMCTQALLAVVLLSLPPAIVALVVGLTVSVVQTATQVQEQTLGYLPKMLAVFLSLAIFGSWMIGYLVRFASSLFELIADVGVQ